MSTDSDEFLPFALPEIGDEEINDVVECLRSGWLTSGPKSMQFERDFALFVGGDVEAIAVNSATAGLHLALEAAGIGPGDEVITTTHTFTATAEVIRYLGATPVFVDIDVNTLCIAVNAIETAITPRTRAIIPVHFAGLSVDMDTVLKLASKYDLKVIEDAAHALPTTLDGKIIGSLDSDAAVFSFYATKTVTTGEGGMLVTHDRQIAKRARTMRLHGIDRDVFNRYTNKRSNWYYEVVAPGYKYNMTDIAASIGINQLKKAYDFQKKRARIAEIYNNEFSKYPVILPPSAVQGDMHSHHLYVLQLTNDAVIDRDQFIEHLFDRKIGCSVHFIPLHLHPYWRETFHLSSEMFPVSQSVYERSISLPIYSRMTDNDVQRVVDAVKVSLGSVNSRPYLNVI